ncbi:MAG: hypothetical protein R2734_08640 [Nocardioides sp.]
MHEHEQEQEHEHGHGHGQGHEQGHEQGVGPAYEVGDLSAYDTGTDRVEVLERIF